MGNLLSRGTASPWTLDGVIEVGKIELLADRLIIEGRRRFYAYSASRKAMLPFESKDKDRPKVRIEIALDKPLSNIEEAHSVIHRIFALNPDELVESTPNYWRSFLREQSGKSSSDEKADGNSQEGADQDRAEEPIQLGKANLKDVTPPKPVFSPEPEYSSEARRFDIQGTVVLRVVIDKQGRVTKPRIIRPIGLGLDEKAIAGVQQWKFKPATLKGQPVAAEMAIEIAFNLY